MDDIKLDTDDDRRAIVEKYLKGREKIRDQIDDWEDPQNLIHHIDRYGFIHDEALPERLSKHEEKVRQKEISRTDKWLKMLNRWDKTNPEKLRKKVYKGIPNSLRGEVWSKLLDVPRVKKEQEGNIFYEDTLPFKSTFSCFSGQSDFQPSSRYKQLLEFGYSHSKDVRQIDLDVNRTFRNNDMFRERYNSKQQELFRILVAYSVYNTEIGYTQGMSQIAALLLMYTSNEEDAFWALDRLMSGEKFAMHGFFIDGFPKLIRFSAHHDRILKKLLPKVHKHLKKYDIDHTLYTLKWFFQCFLDRVPFSLTLRIWDCFMLDGELILTCMSYTLMKLHKKNIVQKGMEDLIHFLQVDLEKDFGYIDDQAIKELQTSINELKKYHLELPPKDSLHTERPSKPFGMMLQADNFSILTGIDDRSITGSIVLINSDSASLAQTSQTDSSSEDIQSTNNLDTVEVNDFCKLQRSCSIYDNVDVNESIEAAKRLSMNSDNRDKTPTRSSRSRTSSRADSPWVFIDSSDNSVGNCTIKSTEDFSDVIHIECNYAADNQTNVVRDKETRASNSREDKVLTTRTNLDDKLAETISTDQQNLSSTLENLNKQDHQSLDEIKPDKLSGDYNKTMVDMVHSTFQVSPSEEAQESPQIQNPNLSQDSSKDMVEQKSSIDKRISPLNGFVDISPQKPESHHINNSFHNQLTGESKEFEISSLTGKINNTSPTKSKFNFVRKTSIPRLKSHKDYLEKSQNIVETTNLEQSTNPSPTPSPPIITDACLKKNVKISSSLSKETITTSPTSPSHSMIPRLNKNSPTHVIENKSLSKLERERIQISHNNSNNSKAKLSSPHHRGSGIPLSTDDSNTTLRIYVPYEKQQNNASNDSNKIKIRVKSPKATEYKPATSILPSIDS